MAAQGRGGCWRGAPAPSTLSSKSQALGHLCFDARDEPLGGCRVIAAGTEGVIPLLGAELHQQIAHPLHVVDRDVIGQFLVAAAVFELDKAVLDARDEPVLLEEPRIAPRWIEAAGLSERGADIANHE